MLDRLANILQKCKVQPDSLLLVGISGGPDSLCLLHALHQLRYPIIAVHVNHRLRQEAEDEAQVVERYATGLGVKFINCQVDVKEYASEYSISIEEAARILRYRSLFEKAKGCEASAVVVGHTADDQVETILMHLLRGSGLVGLRGIEYRTIPNPWSENIPLVRPFLSTWRKEILNYIDEYQLIPIIDRSNQDISFFRNRLRYELLPILEGYNPNIREVLFRTGQSVKDDYSVLQQLADQAWTTTLVQQGKGYLSFYTSNFLELPLSIQRYLLRMALDYHLPGLRDVGYECIERGLVVLADDKRNSQTDLIAGIRLIKEGEHFFLVNNQAVLPSGDYPAIITGEKLNIMLPSTYYLEGSWRLEVEEIPDLEFANYQCQTNSDPFQAWLDISKVDLPFIVRSRMPGDQMKPLGMNGHSMKISDLMINLKLPKRARTTWPLVCLGDEVLWVPGYRLSELKRIQPNTTRVIHLTLTRH
jgi:tRNA(Ile)-lysidine synthase